ncbi:sporulation protein YunB [Alteribacter populi]|uniref:sporulation protein YunB n=1 Tax=Alteribacter populi TaxID=2011011 RepID=UPI000BBA7C94|nr:sporulation protein YunB [Alteribacter populi]
MGIRKKKNFRLFRFKHKRRGPLPFRYVFLISFIIFILLTAQGLYIVEKGIRPTLLNIANTETQRIGTLAINHAITKKIQQGADLNEEMIEYVTTENGKVTAVQFNASLANEFLHQVTDSVQSYLNDIEHGRVRDIYIPSDVDIERDGVSITEDGIIHMIPIGQATNNALLAHLGPRVPVRFSAIGDVKSEFSHEAIELGINNTQITITVDMEVDVKIVIPFSTKTEVVSTSLPVAVVFLQGDVPEFYSAGGDNGVFPAILNQPTQGNDEEVDGEVNEEIDVEINN